MLNEGPWDGEERRSSDRVDRARTPCEVQPPPGYRRWLKAHGGR